MLNEWTTPFSSSNASPYSEFRPALESAPRFRVHGNAVGDSAEVFLSMHTCYRGHHAADSASRGRAITETTKLLNLTLRILLKKCGYLDFRRYAAFRSRVGFCES